MVVLAPGAKLAIGLPVTVATGSLTTIPLNVTFPVFDRKRTILKSTHPSFIDEILLGELKGAILERISQNYAIIDRKYIDKIVRHAKKSEALIEMFEEE